MGSSDSTFRIGHGYDLHRLEPLAPAGDGRPMVLGGVPVDHDAGPVGHSDGDVVLHAVTDAILGAMGEPDIGQLFPDDDATNDGRDSMDFLAEAVRRMRERSLEPTNLDITIICQRPKISPIKQAMEQRIADAIGCGAELVNIKGKTHEGVDAVGEGRAIETHVVVLLRGADA